MLSNETIISQYYFVWNAAYGPGRLLMYIANNVVIDHRLFADLPFFVLQS